VNGERRQYYVIHAGEASHHLTDVRGEKTLLVFSSARRARLFVRENLEKPGARLSESEDPMFAVARALAEGEYSLVECDAMAVSTLALGIGADYLIMDPRPGEPEHLLPVPRWNE